MRSLTQKILFGFALAATMFMVVEASRVPTKKAGGWYFKKSQKKPKVIPDEINQVDLVKENFVPDKELNLAAVPEIIDRRNAFYAEKGFWWSNVVFPLDQFLSQWGMRGSRKVVLPPQEKKIVSIRDMNQQDCDITYYSINPKHSGRSAGNNSPLYDLLIPFVKIFWVLLLVRGIYLIFGNSSSPQTDLVQPPIAKTNETMVTPPIEMYTSFSPVGQTVSR